MGYRVLRAAAVDTDLELIFDHLFDVAIRFGDAPDVAFRRAEMRVVEIEQSLDDLRKVPHQGTRRPDLGATVRNVTKGRAILYFDVDDTRQIVHVLAVFFSGQDHDTRILLRLLS
ncbi:MAG: type II toxin-antitoxin system RelE/ParE family toxin [Silicimonas sp.]|nr:type II toxin-antitoxin system RelE/ParE family toxin [Silicimonas sp.]